MDDQTAYVHRIEERLTVLEQKVGRVKRAHKTHVRRRTVLEETFAQELRTLQELVRVTDAELSQLANETKKFVLSFQNVGTQPQLETLQRRADMLTIEEWVTKKELRRMRDA